MELWLFETKTLHAMVLDALRVSNSSANDAACREAAIKVSEAIFAELKLRDPNTTKEMRMDTLTSQS